MTSGSGLGLPRRNSWDILSVEDSDDDNCWDILLKI